MVYVGKQQCFVFVFFIPKSSPHYLSKCSMFSSSSSTPVFRIFFCLSGRQMYWRSEYLLKSSNSQILQAEFTQIRGHNTKFLQRIREIERERDVWMQRRCEVWINKIWWSLEQVHSDLKCPISRVLRGTTLWSISYRVRPGSPTNRGEERRLIVWWLVLDFSYQGKPVVPARWHVFHSPCCWVAILRKRVRERETEIEREIFRY